MLGNMLEKIWSNYYSLFVVVSYWFLGLCNNFAYVIMLSAAHDILDEIEKGGINQTVYYNISKNISNKYDCNSLSTGAILLADVLPGIFVKLIAPFFVHRISYLFRFMIVVSINTCCYLIVALTPSNLSWLIFVGVGCASISTTFGEITFLSLTTFYSTKLSLLGWGSGTGAAGLFGSLSYSGITSFGVSPRNTILIMLFIPVLMVLAYTALPSLEFTKKKFPNGVNSINYVSIFKLWKTKVNPNSQTDNHSSINIEKSDIKEKEISEHSSEDVNLTISQKIKLIPSLLKYMIPLFLVYISQYFINQGLFELLYFRDDPFLSDHKSQYRWYSTLYGAGVFISRTSIRFIQIKFLPIFPILQIINVFIALSQIFFGYLPSIWFIFVLIVWEGIVAGACYVNAFNLITIEINDQKKKEFSIQFSSLANSIGVASAGAIAIPVHNAICDLGVLA